MKGFRLRYALAGDFPERRPDFGAGGLALAQAAAERGEPALDGGNGDAP